MPFKISREIVLKSKSESFEWVRELYSKHSNRDGDVNLDLSVLGEDDLMELKELCQSQGDNRSVREINAVLKMRDGDLDAVVPSFGAFEEMLRVYLSTAPIRHWIYKEESDGKLYPYLIVDLGTTFSRTDDRPSVHISLASYTADSQDEAMRRQQTSVHFSPGDVANRRLSNILQSAGLYKESQELHDEYDAVMLRYREEIAPKFAEQFRVTGNVFRHAGGWYSRGRETELHRRKVIHDLSPKDFRPHNDKGIACYGGKEGKHNPVDAVVPDHPLVKVFDLNSHDFFWIHSDFMEPYVYDKTLGDKLILPDSHHDLLEVLTNDLDDFTSDFIEGKSAGNVILCKGLPGVGKTLTAEIYSELIGRPLYSIHSGTLGTSASEIEKSLKKVFGRAKRWNCVLLLDEADVFVSVRGDDINKNAVVAEFLRTLEYFDGLMFMTTNRPDDIDEAIISRCVAIIHYGPPSTADLARRSWEALEGQFGITLDSDVRNGLVEMFPDIVQRDMKMLLKLVLKVNKRKDAKLDLETFRRYAMFRNIKIADKKAA